MGQDSNISWCHHTFNPWIGCSKVSEGCKFCYAENWDKRYNEGEHWGPGAPRRITSKANWNQPRKWNKLAVERNERQRVFCASLADVFDNEAPEEARTNLWSLAEELTNLDWLFLTKRPQNIVKMVPANWVQNPLKNVWYGTSVENNVVRDRIKILADIPAAIRFISGEPLIGNIEYPDEFKAINWMIFGGESHDNAETARPIDLNWIRQGIEVCRSVGVTPFVKQLGSNWAAVSKAFSRAGSNPSEWPEDLRIQEFPQSLMPLAA